MPAEQFLGDVRSLLRNVDSNECIAVLHPTGAIIRYKNAATTYYNRHVGGALFGMDGQHSSCGHAHQPPNLASDEADGGNAARLCTWNNTSNATRDGNSTIY